MPVWNPVVLKYPLDDMRAAMRGDASKYVLNFPAPDVCHCGWNTDDWLNTVRSVQVVCNAS